MPTNLRNVPQQIQTNGDDQRLSRLGGATSRGSSPSTMKDTQGASFAAMENTLLKGTAPDAKNLSGGGSGRQFGSVAAGRDLKQKKPAAVFVKQLTADGKSAKGSVKTIKKFSL